MPVLLEIEQQILEAARDNPIHDRLMRRIVDSQYEETSIGHTVFYAHLEATIDKGYVEPTGSNHSNTYTVTELGEQLLESRRSLCPA